MQQGDWRSATLFEIFETSLAENEHGRDEQNLEHSRVHGEQTPAAAMGIAGRKRISLPPKGYTGRPPPET
jgi:hypothetical protein